jgi:large subunit ribosomal protein L29
MKASEIRSLTAQELELKEQNLREELHKTRFKKYTGELADTATVKRLRKDLARVMTEFAVRKTAETNSDEG